jgi:hypothetical protein
MEIVHVFILTKKHISIIDNIAHLTRLLRGLVGPKNSLDASVTLPSVAFRASHLLGRGGATVNG